MRSNYNFLIAVALCLSGYFAYKVYRDRPKLVPSIQLQTADLSAVSVPTAEPTIYVLWTTWCPACQDMLSKTFVLDERIKGRIVLVNDGEKTDLVLNTMKERAYPFKSLLDPHRNFARTLKANSYPSFYIQDKHGRISRYEFGMIYNPDQVLKDWLQKLHVE